MSGPLHLRYTRPPKQGCMARIPHLGHWQAFVCNGLDACELEGSIASIRTQQQVRPLHQSAPLHSPSHNHTHTCSWLTNMSSGTCLPAARADPRAEYFFLRWWTISRALPHQDNGGNCLGICVVDTPATWNVSSMMNSTAWSTCTRHNNAVTASHRMGDFSNAAHRHCLGPK